MALSREPSLPVTRAQSSCRAHLGAVAARPSLVMCGRALCRARWLAVCAALLQHENSIAIAWLGGVCRDNMARGSLSRQRNLCRDKHWVRFVAIEIFLSQQTLLSHPRALGRVERTRNPIAAHVGSVVRAALPRLETHCRDREIEFFIATGKQNFLSRQGNRILCRDRKIEFSVTTEWAIAHSFSFSALPCISSYATTSIQVTQTV